MLLTTRTGSFPIGFRRGWSDWQKNLDQVIAFAQAQSFAGIDVGPLDLADLKKINAAGLRLGSVDLKQPWTALCSPDGEKRRAAADANADYIRAAVAVGVRHFFVVVLPEDGNRKRSENLAFAADGYGRLCQAIAPTSARLVIEGWPGPSPHHPALACTPESTRALFDAVASPVMGLNFDPSHLMRMGIDPLRFVREFGPRIHHVHAKDNCSLDEDLYQFGNLQPATLANPRGFGAHHWRYTIPGHGQAPWSDLFRALKDHGYQGMVSVELEDENFNGTEDGEKRGLIASRDFLVHA